MLGLLGLRISEACHADIDFLGTERGHRTLHVIGKGNKPALIPLGAGRPHPGPGRRRPQQRAAAADPQPTPDGAATPPPGSCAGSPNGPASPTGSAATPCGTLRVTAALDAGVPLRNVQIAARHADPTTRYDRARGNLDRHANCIVAAFIAGAA